MRNIKLMAGIAALCTTLSAFSATDYQALSKELEVMNSVLTTTLKQTSRDEAIRFRSVQTRYLAKQGVIFTVNTSRGSWGLDLDLRRFIPRAPEAPMPPIIVGGDDQHFSIEIHDEWQQAFEDTVEEVERAFRRSNEQLRDVRSEAREVTWEMRELERRKRDLNFELNTASDERRTDIQNEIDELEEELAELHKRNQKIADYANTIETEQQQQIEKQKQAQQQANKAFLAAFEDGIADTLCRFGAGLRALPDDEHITFVLHGFHMNQEQKSQDRIYVFTEPKVKQCVQEKLTPSELLASATVYDF
ncbi:hypothetical protein [Alteromonas oceanisediminis]|uniref:hypothetical protein n=1 Tax=Alteromonas oceanisediminis TaxID=2836180 RepID=UPI001BD93D00|nr:hypothetical protein [Alteromonas oceanisediminis]MBT0585136.1 hypothetical protein [Alteromonas oceanisediminis]